MAGDQRDTLEVLRFELDLLQRGGYRTSRVAAAPLSFFRDSPTCLDFAGAAKPRACRNCLLTEFIPGQDRNKTQACHDIPLDEHGNTIASLQRGYNHVAVEQAVVGWLRQTVARLERERRLELVACP